MFTQVSWLTSSLHQLEAVLDQMESEGERRHTLATQGRLGGAGGGAASSGQGPARGGEEEPDGPVLCGSIANQLEALYNLA